MAQAVLTTGTADLAHHSPPHLHGDNARRSCAWLSACRCPLQQALLSSCSTLPTEVQGPSCLLGLLPHRFKELPVALQQQQR